VNWSWPPDDKGGKHPARRRATDADDQLFNEGSAPEHAGHTLDRRPPGKTAMSNLWRLAVRRKALAALLIPFSASPSAAAADLRKDCQSGQIAACTQILQSNPSDISALGNRGIGFRVIGEYDRAVADLNAGGWPRSEECQPLPRHSALGRAQLRQTLASQCCCSRGTRAGR
jgi:hypothetical protein